MKKSTAQIDIKGALDHFKRSKYPLAPIYEAITNSFEGITQRGIKDGKITVRFYFIGLVPEIKELTAIEIHDNGLGFDKRNFDRFETLLDKSKGYNNRGSGRIQFLHRFNKIKVESTFEENGRLKRRAFDFDSDNFVTNNKIVDAAEKAEPATTILFDGYLEAVNEKAYFDNLEIHHIKNEIKKKFLLRFHLEKEKTSSEVPSISLEFYKNNIVSDEAAIKAEDIPQPLKAGSITIPYLQVKKPNGDEVEWIAVNDKTEVLKWAHFKLPEAELDKNGIYLCSKNVAVQEITIRDIKKNESFSGFRYITAIYGKALDDENNVSHSVDSFEFPIQKDTERLAKSDMFFDPSQEFLFTESIIKGVNQVIPEIYSELLDLQKTKERSVEDIANAHGISIEIAKEADIKLSDDELKITEKIFKKEAEHQSKKNYKIKKLYDSLTELNPSEENYEEKLFSKSQELLSLLPLQNKEELSRYVIRREMVTEVLGMTLDKKLQIQKNWKEKGERESHESLIHDLIFARKSKSTNELNDLWILNEEYLHFDGTSELALKKITDSKGNKLLKDDSDSMIQKFESQRTARRPDIFLFAEEKKCVLIEFKAPDVDLSEHLHQMTRYCKLIANCSIAGFNQFYCYLIGEKISQLDLPDDYISTAYSDWVKPFTPINSAKEGEERIQIASAYTEVIKLSSIHTRALRRNKSFADKLGIRLDKILHLHE